MKAIYNYLREVVEDEEKDVILVTHSSSGVPGSEALKGSRQEEMQELRLERWHHEAVVCHSLCDPCMLSADIWRCQTPDYMKLDIGVTERPMCLRSNALTEIVQEGVSTVNAKYVKRDFYEGAGFYQGIVRE